MPCEILGSKNFPKIGTTDNFVSVQLSCLRSRSLALFFLIVPSIKAHNVTPVQPVFHVRWDPWTSTGTTCTRTWRRSPWWPRPSSSPSPRTESWPSRARLASWTWSPDLHRSQCLCKQIIIIFPCSYKTELPKSLCPLPLWFVIFLCYEFVYIEIPYNYY